MGPAALALALVLDGSYEPPLPPVKGPRYAQCGSGCGGAGSTSRGVQFPLVLHVLPVQLRGHALEGLKIDNASQHAQLCWRPVGEVVDSGLQPEGSTNWLGWVREVGPTRLHPETAREQVAAKTLVGKHTRLEDAKHTKHLVDQWLLAAVEVLE